MGLNVPLISFVPATPLRSADMNANFASLNGAANFTGGVPTMNFDGGAITSDGHGNIRFNGKLGKVAAGDIFDWATTSTDLYVKCASALGAITFLIGSSTTVAPAAQVTNGGLVIMSGGLQLKTGSISRSSTFSGTATGVYNHNNNGTPNVVYCLSNVASGPETLGFDSPTPTQVHVTAEFGNGFLGLAVAF